MVGSPERVLAELLGSDDKVLNGWAIAGAGGGGNSRTQEPVSFHCVLRTCLVLRLPLHIAGHVRAAPLEWDYMVDHVAGHAPEVSRVAGHGFAWWKARFAAGFLSIGPPLRLCAA